MLKQEYCQGFRQLNSQKGLRKLSRTDALNGRVMRGF